MVKLGNAAKLGQILAKGNLTNDKGMIGGTTAQIGLGLYLGESIGDAMVASEDFAERLTSVHLFSYDIDYKRGVKGGKALLTRLLFTDSTTNTSILDDHGITQPMQILQSGDPCNLTTLPRTCPPETSRELI